MLFFRLGYCVVCKSRQSKKQWLAGMALKCALEISGLVATVTADARELQQRHVVCATNNWGQRESTKTTFRDWVLLLWETASNANAYLFEQTLKKLLEIGTNSKNMQVNVSLSGRQCQGILDSSGCRWQHRTGWKSCSNSATATWCNNNHHVIKQEWKQSLVYPPCFL